MPLSRAAYRYGNAFLRQASKHARSMGTAAHRNRAAPMSSRAVGASPTPVAFFGGLVGLGGAWLAAYTFRNELRSAAESIGIMRPGRSPFSLEGRTLTESQAWELFRMIDSGGDGSISKAELRRFFILTDKYRGKPKEAYEAVNHFYRLHDHDNSNTIDFGEFIDVLRLDDVKVEGHALPRAEPTLRKLFQALDTAKSGQVTVAELDVFLTKMKGFIHVDDAVVDSITGTGSDQDRDGFIDYTEFVTMWLQVAQASFDSYDKDKTGTLSAAEVARMLNRTSIDPMKSLVMRRYDEDDSGALDFSEFFQYYTVEALHQYKAYENAAQGTYVFGVRIF